MAPFKKYTIIAIVNFVIFTILLCIVETGLNLRYGPQSKNAPKLIRYIHLKEFKASADYYSTPTDDYLKNKENLEQKPYRIRTDNDGFLIGPANKDSSETVDIIFYGGSTTACVFVDEEKRFPYLVQNLMNSKLNVEIQVLNSGVPGKTSKLSTLDFLSKGLKKKPKLVVLMHNINDLVLLQKTGNFFDGPKSRSVVHSNLNIGRLRVINNSFLKTINSIVPNVYTAGNTVYNLTFKKSNDHIDEWRGFRNEGINDTVHICSEFEKSIKTFIAIAKSNKIEVLLMTQFNRMNINDKFIVDNFYNSHRKESRIQRGIKETIGTYTELNNIIRKIAKDENLNLLDLDKLVPKNNNYIVDQVHLNTRGSEYVAKIVSESNLDNYYK